MAQVSLGYFLNSDLVIRYRRTDLDRGLTTKNENPLYVFSVDSDYFL